MHEAHVRITSLRHAERQRLGPPRRRLAHPPFYRWGLEGGWSHMPNQEQPQNQHTFRELIVVIRKLKLCNFFFFLKISLFFLKATT